MRLLVAHIVEWIHVVVLRHRPLWTCGYLLYVWPDVDHDCRFCRYWWGGALEDD